MPNWAYTSRPHLLHPLAPILFLCAQCGCPPSCAAGLMCWCISTTAGDLAASCRLNEEMTWVEELLLVRPCTFAHEEKIGQLYVVCSLLMLNGVIERRELTRRNFLHSVSNECRRKVHFIEQFRIRRETLSLRNGRSPCRVWPSAPVLPHPCIHWLLLHLYLIVLTSETIHQTT